ncbi:hypothetical protein Tco_1272625 [Tanacetum coccineum]
MGEANLTCIPSKRSWMRTVLKQLRTARMGVVDGSATEGNAKREAEVPLRRKRSVRRRARTEFYTPAFAQFHAPRSTDVLPHADISESAGPPRQARQKNRQGAELDELLLVDRHGLVDFDDASRYNPAPCTWRCWELMSTKTTLLSAMTAIKERIRKTEPWQIYAIEATQGRLEKDHLLSAQYNLFRPKPALTEPLLTSNSFILTGFYSYVVGYVVLTQAWLLLLHINELEFLHLQIPEHSSSPSPYVSGAGVVVVDKLPDDEIVDPRVKTVATSSVSESESDDDIIEDYIPPIPYGAFKDWEIDLLLLRRYERNFGEHKMMGGEQLEIVSQSFVHAHKFTLITVGKLWCWKCYSVDSGCLRESYEWLVPLLSIVPWLSNPPWNLPFASRFNCQRLTSPEQTATDHAGSFDAAVPSLVSAACVAAAAYFVPAVFFNPLASRRSIETGFNGVNTSLGEDCWILLKSTKCRVLLLDYLFVLQISTMCVPADSFNTILMIMFLMARTSRSFLPDYVFCGNSV